MNDDNPLSPENVAKADQAGKFMVESLPALWWGLYDGCVKCGFSKEQAMMLVISQIGSMTPRG